MSDTTTAADNAFDTICNIVAVRRQYLTKLLEDIANSTTVCEEKINRIRNFYYGTLNNNSNTNDDNNDVSFEEDHRDMLYKLKNVGNFIVANDEDVYDDDSLRDVHETVKSVTVVVDETNDEIFRTNAQSSEVIPWLFLRDELLARGIVTVASDGGGGLVPTELMTSAAETMKSLLLNRVKHDVNIPLGQLLRVSITTSSAVDARLVELVAKRAKQIFDSIDKYTDWLQRLLEEETVRYRTQLSLQENREEIFRNAYDRLTAQVLAEYDEERTALETAIIDRQQQLASLNEQLQNTSLRQIQILNAAFAQRREHWIEDQMSDLAQNDEEVFKQLKLVDEKIDRNKELYARVSSARQRVHEISDEITALRGTTAEVQEQWLLLGAIDKILPPQNINEREKISHLLLQFKPEIIRLRDTFRSPKTLESVERLIAFIDNDVKSLAKENQRFYDILAKFHSAEDEMQAIMEHDFPRVQALSELLNVCAIENENITTDMSLLQIPKENFNVQKTNNSLSWSYGLPNILPKKLQSYSVQNIILVLNRETSTFDDIVQSINNARLLCADTLMFAVLLTSRIVNAEFAIGRVETIIGSSSNSSGDDVRKALVSWTKAPDADVSNLLLILSFRIISRSGGMVNNHPDIWNSTKACYRYLQQYMNSEVYGR